MLTPQQAASRAKVSRGTIKSGRRRRPQLVRVTGRIAEHRDAAPTTADYIARRTEIDYATYVRYRGKLLTE